METAHFQLSVVSADQRLPSQIIEIESEWTAIDLKRHLSKVYPGEPPIESQKLIFAGRILSDDSKLRVVIGQEPILRTVHLVLSPSVANKVKAAMAARRADDYPSEDLNKLKEQYLQYLNDYYCTTNSEALIPSYDSQTGNGNDVINVEIEVAEGAEQREENAFQHLARALGFRPAQEAPEVQNVELGGEDPIDLFDFAYAVFRVSILVAICITYASWQRMALVIAVGLYAYWYAITTNNTAISVAEVSAGSVAVVGRSRVGQIAEALRAAGDTSVRLVCAIFSSLVPELPARID
ncbi:unnamed protein product [Hydatigera taeniaeformis]|uniref:Ubiquitin-like domain-containing protein n=1 Tax=Hydatigena taeniaeformis TaxID=6205 RepID=A0A0R3WIW8_HYDTA|nr:unnamed protein product [Hydatigera taeniaeformis]